MHTYIVVRVIHIQYIQYSVLYLFFGTDLMATIELLLKVWKDIVMGMGMGVIDAAPPADVLMRDRSQRRMLPSAPLTAHVLK